MFHLQLQSFSTDSLYMTHSFVVVGTGEEVKVCSPIDRPAISLMKLRYLAAQAYFAGGNRIYISSSEDFED